MSGIKVGLRFRPILKKESVKSKQWITKGNDIHSINQKYKFNFQNIFDEFAANDEVYETLGRPIVDKFLDGFNGTILTFGQTSSGKTHTMVGNQYTTGIIEMAINDIVKTTRGDFKLHVGYIEIYNEKIMDLLDTKNAELKIFDCKGVALTNQKQIEVNSKEEIMSLFHRGNKSKRMGESIINDNSSRSHTIFSINLESVDENGRKKSSNLFLVDLAGSEKPDMTKGSFNEGLFINKSLLALGKIVRLLSEKTINEKKLRYRDSLLTRLLSPALGGNSFTSMICTLSPTALDETFYTICFAQNAEKAKCKPKINATHAMSKEVKFLRKEVDRLKNELELTKSAIFNDTYVINNTIIDLSVCENKFEVIPEISEKEEKCEKSRKRGRSPDHNIQENSQKIFVKTVELSDEEKVEFEKLKFKFEQIEAENQALKSEKLELIEKSQTLEQKLTGKFKKKLQAFKDIITNKKLKINSLKKKFIEVKDEIHNKEIIAMYKNLTILGLEKQLTNIFERSQTTTQIYEENIKEICDDFNKIIEDKNGKIKNLSQNDANRYDLSIILQSQLKECTLECEKLREENLEIKKINHSLKKNFRASLKNTREQLSDMVNLKQEQAMEFNKKMREFQNQELRNHIRLENHYEKRYKEQEMEIEKSHGEILRLKFKIELKSEEILQLKNDQEKKPIKSQNDKIKFIKQQFHMKLIDKTNQFQKLLKVKESELKTMKNHSFCENVIQMFSNKHELRMN